MAGNENVRREKNDGGLAREVVENKWMLRLSVLVNVTFHVWMPSGIAVCEKDAENM